MSEAVATGVRPSKPTNKANKTYTGIPLPSPKGPTARAGNYNSMILKHKPTPSNLAPEAFFHCKGMKDACTAIVSAAVRTPRSPAQV